MSDEWNALFGAIRWATVAITLGGVVVFTDAGFFAWLAALSGIISACHLGEAECERLLRSSPHKEA